MSTPRTDAVKIRCGFQAVPEPMLKHAQELERENAALRADLLIEEERSIYWRDNEGKAMTENAALRDLLNRWAKIAAIGVVDFVPDWAAPIVDKLSTDTLNAIDAARKEAQP